MSHLLAAPDKFRGTAEASQVAAAAARGARAAGWTSTELPLADGGEGLLEAVGGAVMSDEVTGPLGSPVVAEWRLLPSSGPGEPPTAIIEMARASGLAVAGGPSRNRPMEASTVGTGELVLRAISQGAGRVVVGCGGSATTDGGEGAIRAIGSPDALRGVELIAACDVTATFVESAAKFGAQKGATPGQVRALTARLGELGELYRARFGVDLAGVAGSGAAGGLAGGLVALGGRIVSGFDFVADLVGLEDQLGAADLVMTGEGRLDSQSFAGKVVGGVMGRVNGRLPVLCVAGEVARGTDRPPFELVSLAESFGRRRAMTEVLVLIEQVVAERLERLERLGQA